MKATAWAAATVLLTVAAMHATIATASSQPAAIALVTSSATNPPAGDQVVVDRLTSRGHTVTLVDDGSVGDLSVADHDLVAISGTVRPYEVGDALSVAPVPVVTWEHQLYDDLGLTTGADMGTTPTTTTLDIVDTDHPIAAGLSGVVDVTQDGRRLNWGLPADAASVIAVESRAPNRPVAFAYESGATMVDGPAPARRVGLHFDPAAPTGWTDDAGALFDAAVDWALGEQPEADNQPPVVDAGPGPLVVEDASVVLAGTVSDDGTTGSVTSTWSGPSGVEFDDPSDPATTATLPEPGTFVLTLTADDGEYAVSDEVTITFDGPGDEPGDDPTGDVDVLWVTASTNPTYGEQPGVERLEAAGMNVRVADDDAVTPADADGMELVVITSSVTPSAIDPEFADVHVPIMVWEPFVFDELGLVEGGSAGGQTSRTKQIHVADSEHELTAGMSGDVEVLSTRKPVSWGIPLPAADVIATTTAGADRATVFAYDDGALTATGPAPARRLAFFLSYSGPRQLSEIGWSLWDAAIDWAVAAPVVDGTSPDAVFDASTAAGEAPLDVTFDAGGSSDPDDDIASYEWDFGDGTTGTGPVQEHTFELAGTYEVTLTVTDATGRSDVATAEVLVRSPWALPDHPFRVRLDIGPFADDRADTSIVAPFDATASFDELGAPHATFDPASLRVVETDAGGNVIDPATIFQFDPGPGFEPTRSASGDLVVLLGGTSGAGDTRHFDVYFDTAGGDHAPAELASEVTATSGLSDEGLDAIRIATPTAEWWFDRDGGGFSGLVDRDGNDWISFNDLTGAAGRFRGIPNLTHPEGYFHPGSANTTSRVLSNGPLRVTIESTSVGAGYTTRWHVYPAFAELEVVRAAGSFWFLYEGTPGGALDPSSDRVTRSDGTTSAASDEFSTDLAADDTGAEWVVFGDPVLDRSLFLAHLEDDGVVDSYRPLDDEMTVFGFGRGDDVTPRLGDLPATFRVGLLETADDTAGPAAVRSLLVAPPVTVGAGEQLTPGDLPPEALAAGSPRVGEPPLTVVFDAGGSSDGGTITAYRWDFGDGAPIATGATVTHTYENAGRFVATLSVTDDAGHTDTDEVVVSVGTPALERVADGLIALYEFAGEGDDIIDTSGVQPALDLVVADPPNVTRLEGGGLSIDQPTAISSTEAATKINESVVASGEITVEAWVRTSDIDQNGPARLASISASPQARNVMIGQGNYATSGDRIEARLRSSGTDPNGRPALISPVGSFDDSLTQVVYTRDADGTTALHIDGSLASMAVIPGDLSTWDTALPLTLVNEVDGSRPWLGELHLMAFYDRALTPAEICTNLGAGPGTSIIGPNLAPTACLTTSGSGAEAPAVIAFDASASRDLDGVIVEHRWDFGDGTTRTTTAAAVSHQYLEPGDYTATLTTVDDLGAEGTASAKVTVLPASSGSRIAFTHLASPDPRLPSPPIHDGGADDEQQTASLVADLDGDGDDDIVIAGRKPPGAGIVWYEFVDIDTGWSPHVLDSEVLRIEAGGAVHDVDGDGDTDIIFGRDGTGAEIWWWENPSDSVGPSSTEWNRHLIKDGGDDKHHDMSFGDVDDDGTDELVFWNQRPANRLVVAEIPADPTTPWPTTEVFSNGTVESEGIAIADVDGDGIDDIVGAGLWFERQPDGTFEPHQIDADYAFSRTAVGQLVAGGRPEIVIDSGDSIGPLSWYEWDSDTDSWTRHELLRRSAYGHSLRLGDIDGDGNLDIFSSEMVSPFDTVVLENPQAATRIFYGDGAGEFELQTVATGIDHHESQLADIDADGDLDIVGKRYNIAVPGIDIWLNDGLDPFGRWERTALDDPAPWTPLFVFDADIDADGDTDIVTGGWWYEQPSDPDGDWVRHPIGEPLANVAAVADLDGDGDVDVIGSHWKLRDAGPNGAFSWGRNDGDGNFTVFPVGDTGDGPFLQGSTVATLTEDGPLELVLSWNTGAAGTNTIVVPSDLDTVPDQAPWTMRELSDWSGGEQIVAHDIDLDGDLDLMTGSNWLRNDDDTWVPVEIFELGTGQPDRIVFGDVDGDGDDDVVIGNGHDPNGELSWYERPDDPEARWERHLVANLTNPQSVDVADLDGDGDVDIVVGEHDMDDPDRSRLLIYENLGTGAGWASRLVHTGDEHHDGAHLVDLDADGDLDIASIGFLQGRVVVYRNGR